MPVNKTEVLLWIKIKEKFLLFIQEEQLVCSKIKMENLNLNLINSKTFFMIIHTSQMQIKLILILLMILWSLLSPYLVKRFGINFTNFKILLIQQTCQSKDSIKFVHFLKTNMKVNIYQILTEYDAFVILHGTDTLSYTASALSFMI